MKRSASRLVALAAGLLLAVASGAQQATITPNYKDADIRQVIEAVSEISGQNFVLDPRVKAQVTMLSSVPMTAEAFYEAFLSILSVYGFVAVPSGNVIKILPDANARQVPGSEMTGSPGARPDDILTQVIQVQNVAASQLVPILRPLIPQYGHLAAYPASNMLIISDRAANVQRMLRIIKRIDQGGDDEVEVLPLQYATASQVVILINTLMQGARAEGAQASKMTTVVADDRTNSVLISGDKAERLKLRALIAHLDTPLESGGDTQVRYLRYAESSDLAEKLQTQYQKISEAEQTGPEPIDITVWADESTNALIITAPPKVMRSMMTVIDKLDIRRLQVMLETIIVEVTAERAADLGVTWAIADSDLENIAGVTEFQGTAGVTSLAGIIGNDDVNPAEIIQPGITLGLGRISDSGLSFVALIEALEADADTNIMGTPILVTLDNEEAEIQVGQEVPFVTGSFTEAGGVGAVNPFQTIEREEVGLTLKITPQINEGNAVRLKIEQEISQLSESAQAVDLITTNRRVNTAVIVEDEGVLVLGGLIQDELRERVERVPVLGSIPLVGALFRSTSSGKVKTNLMFFIRPTILRDDVQAAFQTNAKYNFIRQIQLEREPDMVLPTWEAKRPAPPVLPWSPNPVPSEEEEPPTIDLRGLGQPKDQPAEGTDGE
ncbi:MAG: type II secretion system secretin GspD [Chromatiales bacterium]|nr:MAG: type II secretion system secretin GspD [Chromatiales bacterium]